MAHASPLERGELVLQAAAHAQRQLRTTNPAPGVRPERSGDCAKRRSLARSRPKSACGCGTSERSTRNHFGPNSHVRRNTHSSTDAGRAWSRMRAAGLIVSLFYQVIKWLVFINFEERLLVGACNKI